MGFDLAETKRAARQALHGLASIAVSYSDDTLSEPVVVTVRYHNKLSRPIDGGFESDGLAQILASVDRLVFSESNLAAAPQPDGSTVAVELRHRGVITIPQYNLAFSLDTLEPSDGPENVYWTVVRE